MPPLETTAPIDSPPAIPSSPPLETTSSWASPPDQTVTWPPAAMSAPESVPETFTNPNDPTSAPAAEAPASTSRTPS
jgi:hypothetical protein